MSNLSGRRAPNIANLNVIPSEHEQQQAANYNIPPEFDVGLFADTSGFLNLDWSEEMGSGEGHGDSSGLGAKADGHSIGNGSGPNGPDGLNFPTGESCRTRHRPHNRPARVVHIAHKPA